MLRRGTDDDFSAIAEASDECNLAAIVKPQPGTVQKKFHHHRSQERITDGDDLVHHWIRPGEDADPACIKFGKEHD